VLGCGQQSGAAAGIARFHARAFAEQARHRGGIAALGGGDEGSFGW
jgi:hypothetical protein